MKVFVLSIDYERKGDEYLIRIWGRTEDGKKILILDHYDWYIYIIPKTDKNKIYNELKKIRYFYRIEEERKKYLGKEYDVFKCYLKPKDYDDAKKLLDPLKEQGLIEKKEVDISYHRKYIVDKRLYPLHFYNFELEPIGKLYGVDTYRLKSFKESNGKYELKVLAFDIEVLTNKAFPDPKKDPVISIAFYSKDFKRVITYKEPEEKKDYYVIVKSEYELFKKFEETIKEYDPDILVGYNSNNFDLWYLYERAKVLNYKFTIGWDRKGFIYAKKGEDKKFRITGIQHIDFYDFVVHILGGQLQSTTYSLDEVAKELLGEGKIEISWEELYKIWTSGKNVEKLLEYNLKDAELTYKLFEKFKTILFELTRIVGQNLDDVAHMTYGQLVEWYLIRRSRDFNEIVPNRPKQEEVQRRKAITYKGAYVFEPKPGLYTNVVVYDFRSLYPSIIILHNVSPDTLKCEHEECKSNGITVETSIGKWYVWFCTKRIGFIPSVLKEIFEERAELKRRLKTLPKDSEEYRLLDARQYSLKILANATYGYMGFPNARWYCLDCAAAITAWGRKYISFVAEEAKKRGFKIIYGDTDSIFIQVNNKEEALKFLEYINSKLKKPMELELEDFYPRGIFVSKRTELLEGAKKKYALINEKGEIKLRGFETVRRDWAEIAKETQRKVIEILLKEGDVEKAIRYVQEVIDNLKKHKVPVEKLILYEQLRKPLEEYKVEAPHVVAAKKLKQRGFPVGQGTVVSYIICKGGERIRDKVRLPDEVKPEDYDPEYYIEHQVIPAVEKIFEAVGVPKERLLSKGQKTLLSFFK